MLTRVLDSGSLIGATDQIIAESIYVSDPDGIGLEFAVEQPMRLKLSRRHGG